MNKLIIVSIIIVWIICGALGYAINFAYFQEEYPIYAENHCRENAGTSLILTPLGPIYLLISFLDAGFAKDGLKWSC